MKVTNQLVKHLCEQLGLDKKHLDPSTRVDAEVSAFVVSQLTDGKLGVDQIKALTADVVTKEADDKLAAFETKILGQIGDMLKSFKPAESKDAVVDGSKGLGAADLVKAAGGSDVSGDAGNVRVKEAVERYSHNRTVLTYNKSASESTRNAMGKDTPVIHPWGSELHSPSMRDRAIAGAWFKHAANRSARAKGIELSRGLQLTDHEKQLVRWAVDNCEFVGPIGSDRQDERCDHEFKCEKAVTDLQKKALLDDTTSGGLEAVPIEFDAAVIMAPLLNGELFPFIDFQQASRRRMEGYQMGEFTFSNTAEGTTITSFTTASFISAFDTTINTITGSCDVGLDFLDDSPAAIGSQITTRWGEGFLKEMDRQIAVGTGTGEMTGLTVTAGVTNPAAVAVSLPYRVDEAESLLFAVPVQFRRQSGQRAVFLSNDTVYRRVRSIPVGTNDARRVYGMEYENYVTAGHPHKIQADIASTRLGFYCLDRFRGYRRSGYTVSVVGTTDRDNALKNQQTVVVRARYGGQMTLAAAGALMTTLPTS